MFRNSRISFAFLKPPPEVTRAPAAATAELRDELAAAERRRLADGWVDAELATVPLEEWQ